MVRTVSIAMILMFALVAFAPVATQQAVASQTVQTTVTEGELVQLSVVTEVQEKDDCDCKSGHGKHTFACGISLALVTAPELLHPNRQAAIHRLWVDDARLSGAEKRLKRPPRLS